MQQLRYGEYENPVMVESQIKKYDKAFNILFYAVLIDVFLITFRDPFFCVGFDELHHFIWPAFQLLFNTWPLYTEMAQKPRSILFIPYLIKLTVELVSTVIFVPFLYVKFQSRPSYRTTLNWLAWFGRISHNYSTNENEGEAKTKAKWMFLGLLVGFMYQLFLLYTVMRLWLYSRHTEREEAKNDQKIETAQ